MKPDGARHLTRRRARSVIKFGQLMMFGWATALIGGPGGIAQMFHIRRIALGAAAGLGLASAAVAHHSFAVFDFSQEIPFEGEVATLNFKNPHIAMTLKRTLENGEVEIINFIEGAPANMLVRNGLRPAMIEPGTTITAIGSPLREDPSQYFLRRIRLEDGREFQ